MSIVDILKQVGEYLPLLVSIESGAAQQVPTPAESFDIDLGASVGKFKVTIPAAQVTIQKVG